MIPIKRSNDDIERAPPKDWDEEKDGPCTNMPFRIVEPGYLEMAFHPSDEELAALNQGGVVILTIAGPNHYPLKIGVSLDRT